MKLHEAMLAVKTVVDAELKRFFAKKREEAERIHLSVVELVDQVTDVTLRGGKRMRPFLCWLGYAAVIASEARQSHVKNKREIASSPSAPRNDMLMHAMIGLELFQTFALIHDDIMDKDKERRGGKTIHTYFNEKLKMKNEKWGESMGILAGDLALTWAEELFALSLRGASLRTTRQSHVTNKQGIASPSERSRNDINKLYQTMKEEVIYGQTLDIVGAEKHKADELKTALYSVVRPLQIGSSLAGDGAILNVWESYGVAVGRLFQLRDDVLDGELTEDECAKEAKGLQQKALDALESLDTSNKVKQLLIDFAQFVQMRKS